MVRPTAGLLVGSGAAGWERAGLLGERKKDYGCSLAGKLDDGNAKSCKRAVLLGGRTVDDGYTALLGGKEITTVDC